MRVHAGLHYMLNMTIRSGDCEKRFLVYIKKGGKHIDNVIRDYVSYTKSVFAPGDILSDINRLNSLSSDGEYEYTFIDQYAGRAVPHDAYVDGRLRRVVFVSTCEW